jgi:transcriptional regulator with XRE-family HTH domain
MRHPDGTDFSVSYVSAVERGQIRPSLDALEQFAAVLRTSTATLLSAQNDQEIGPLQNVSLTLPSEEDDFEQSIILLRNAHKALSEDLIARALQLAEEAVRHLRIAKEMSDRRAD